MILKCWELLAQSYCVTFWKTLILNSTPVRHSISNMLRMFMKFDVGKYYSKFIDLAVLVKIR